MRGFTLLELLIAITVTVMIAVGAMALVFQFSESRQRMQTQLNTLDALQRTEQQLRQDFQQWVPNRPVRDALNNLQPALMIDPQEGVALTRHGRTRLFGLEGDGSNLLRVRLMTYSLSDPRCRSGLSADIVYLQAKHDSALCLVRQWQTYLDGGQFISTQEQVLMAPIEGLQIELVVYDLQQQATEFDRWPTQSERFPEIMSMGIAVTITTEALGASRFFWSLSDFYQQEILP